VLVWWLSDPSRLSRRAKRAIEASSIVNEVVISAMTVFEIATLLRRGRLEFSVPPEVWFTALRALPELSIEPFSAEIAWVAGTFDGALSGDPADRAIVATAQLLGIALITADERLRATQAVPTIW
jgi:PIN domain nuclease of toxin-antitoxin system